MQTLEELKRQQQQIIQIILDANQDITDIEAIVDSLENTDEVFEYRYNGVFDRVLGGLWNHLVLQVCILSDKTEHYSIPKLLNKMVENYKTAEWGGKVNKNELNEYLDLLNATEFVNEIERIKGVRDKHYAHLDRNRENYSLSIEEIKKVIGEYEKVMNELSVKTFGTQHGFKRVTYAKYENIIMDLMEYNKGKWETKKDAEY
ncbi:MAG: hypothetical protein Q8M29_02375 [Bacteroidota bacterium]|nr:hypothetical protein [Bacteroidota bacterium]